jgi:hypothetical protein
MIRRSSLPDDEVPLYFEGIPLKTWALVAGWPLGLACAVGGVALAARASGFAAELSGVVAAALGSVMIVALLRCRRFEIVVGARLLTVGAGPVLRRVPVGLIDRVEDRAATSWRRLYSDRELVLGLTAGDRVMVFPSNDQQEFMAAVGSRRLD